MLDLGQGTIPVYHISHQETTLSQLAEHWMGGNHYYSPEISFFSIVLLFHYCGLPRLLTFPEPEAENVVLGFP